MPAHQLCPASPELTRQVDEQISAMQEALNQSGDTTASCAPDTKTPGTQDAWLFRNIWIRLMAPVGFTLPGLASFSVVPTFEVLVQKTLPEGWQVYQPAQKLDAAELPRLD